MALELVNNTTKQGLFNRLKGLYTLVEDAYNDASDTTSGYNARVSDVYDRFKSRPEPNEGTSEKLLESYNNRYKNVVTLSREQGTKTILRMVGDEYKIVDNSLPKSLAFLVQDMQDQNQTIKRAITSISVSELPTNIGKATIAITDIISVPGLKGLTDQSGTQKQVEKSSYVYNETIALSVISPETNNTPAEVVFEGDLDKDKINDYLWATGGSGIKDVKVRSVLVDSTQNILRNASFESILDSGPEGWDFRTFSNQWGTKIHYSNTVSSHGLNSLMFLDGNTNYDTNAIHQSGIQLRPYRVYFLCFDAYANVTMPTSARLRIRFTSDDSQMTSQTFYNSVRKFEFGSGADKIPHNTTDFGTIVIPVITDNSVVVDRTYRFEVGVAIEDSAQSWPANGKVFLDRVFIVEGTQLYKMGPYVAILGSIKGKQLKIGDGWVITISGNEMEYWNWVFYQLFDITEHEIHLPVSDSPTITKTNVS